jgi:hypothetical protein
MAAFANQVKLFGRWSFDDVSSGDISVEDFIAVKPKDQVYVPHTGGRYQVKRFRKAQCPIVERLVNSLMRKGVNNGKKFLGVRIVQQGEFLLLFFLPYFLQSTLVSYLVSLLILCQLYLLYNKHALTYSYIILFFSFFLLS